MGQALRITFEQQDYTIKLLSPTPPDLGTTELEVEVLEENRTLVLNDKVWKFKENEDQNLNRLADAIGKSIRLRYRI
jgi:hypothetical protein